MGCGSVDCAKSHVFHPVTGSSMTMDLDDAALGEVPGVRGVTVDLAAVTRQGKKKKGGKKSESDDGKYHPTAHCRNGHPLVTTPNNIASKRVDKMRSCDGCRVQADPLFSCEGCDYYLCNQW